MPWIVTLIYGSELNCSKLRILENLVKFIKFPQTWDRYMHQYNCLVKYFKRLFAELLPGSAWAFTQ